MEILSITIIGAPLQCPQSRTRFKVGLDLDLDLYCNCDLGDIKVTTDIHTIGW